MDNKSELRTRAKIIRKGLDMKNISQKLVQKIAETDIFKKAKHVMIFHPLDNEVDLTGLLTHEKYFYLPKTEGENLFVCPFKTGDELICGKYKIFEPCSTPVNPEVLDLIIVPALMIDKNGNRLGYGKGYYDRFLKTCNAKTLCAIPKELFADKICTEIHDKKIDYIIYE